MAHWKSISGILSMLSLVSCTALSTVDVPGQEKRTVDRSISDGKVAMAIGKYTELPEATEECAPVECEWWKRLREAGNQLQRSGGAKSKRNFVELFIEGIEGNYRVPVEDRAPHVLVPSRPELKDLLRSRKVSGEVRLIVEYRLDGSVGDIKVESGIAPDIDSRIIRSKQQQLIFLPAVRDGKFVTEWAPTATKINTRN